MLVRTGGIRIVDYSLDLLYFLDILFSPEDSKEGNNYNFKYNYHVKNHKPPILFNDELLPISKKYLNATYFLRANLWFAEMEAEVNSS